jgi:xylulokinase
VSDPVFVGLDLGTSGLKGVVQSSEGEVLASARAGYATARPAPGRAEQDPADWLQALGEVVASLAAEVASGRWGGIGLSGMIPTLALADTDLNPIGPAITWEDDRAEEEGEVFRSGVGGDDLYRRTGQWVDGRYLLPMWQWIERHELSWASAARHVLGAKDLLFSRMTGVVATDPSTATGFGCFSLDGARWDPDLAGDLLSRLPDLHASTWSAPLSPLAANELGIAGGIPVVLGAADSVAGALAVGAVQPGDAASLWGTSTVILGVSDALVFDDRHRFLVTPLALGDMWGLEMDLVSTGSAFAWTATLLGLDDEEAVLALAAIAPSGANGLRFLPFLGPGEQGALWDPTLSGTLHGLTLTHGREDVARALVEGIAIEHRRCLDVLDDAGVAPHEVIAAGAPIATQFFAALLADVSGRTLVRSNVGTTASARGAALVAAAAGGVDVPRVGTNGERVEPDPAAREARNGASDAHDRLLSVLRKDPSG